MTSLSGIDESHAAVATVDAGFKDAGCCGMLHDRD
jgi:hypothetical protein